MHAIRAGAIIPSPLGDLWAEATDRGLSRLNFGVPDGALPTGPHPLLEVVAHQLEAYWAGTLRSFSIPLDLQGSPFQLKVWESLLSIPWGRTRTYLDQAKALGDVKAIRAVASANGRNPVAIVVPCHRVIGSDGSLTGYAGGLERKKALLVHEGAWTDPQPELGL
ncbi:MAG TPA: methylated-DNA--[protein]-cysteine S-methyltransferase [Spirochaetia bacterium]|jgi:methylated-DNA-[protein]-cysteine S-methyltransferase|nr:methylated-DNA--[protein]-cysteine S-methyltransferase [Spirochaetia bacterium]